MNPAAANGHEGPHCNEYPEKYSLQKRSNSDFAESLHGEPHSNQAERNGQTDSAKMIEYMIALEPVINFEKRHVVPECSKPAQNALFARCGTEWIYGFPHESQSLAKAALIPLGLRAQS